MALVLSVAEPPGQSGLEVLFKEMLLQTKLTIALP